MLPLFYVTFGLHLGQQPLESSVTQHAHPQGYAVVAAGNRDQAQFMASYVYGRDGWANVYTESEFDATKHPLGQLAKFVVREEPAPAPRVLVAEDGRLLILGMAKVWTPGEITVFANELADAGVAAVKQVAAAAADAERLSNVGVKRHDDMF